MEDFVGGGGKVVGEGRMVVVEGGRGRYLCWSS